MSSFFFNHQNCSLRNCWSPWWLVTGPHVCILVLARIFLFSLPYLCLWLAPSTGMSHARLLTYPRCWAHSRELSVQDPAWNAGFILLIFLTIGPSNSSTSSIYYRRNIGHLGTFSHLLQLYAVFRYFCHLGLCSTLFLNISREEDVSSGRGCPGHMCTHICYLINYLNA